MLWLCTLAVFSSDLFSAEHTGKLLLRILHWLGRASRAEFEWVHFFVRKTAHFCSYGLLSALAFISWRATFPALARWSFRWAGLALLLTLAAASADEFHQIFVSSRTGNANDVLLDMAGAAFFQLVIAIAISRRESA